MYDMDIVVDEETTGELPSRSDCKVSTIARILRSNSHIYFFSNINGKHIVAHPVIDSMIKQVTLIGF